MTYDLQPHINKVESFMPFISHNLSLWTSMNASDRQNTQLHTLDNEWKYGKNTHKKYTWPAISCHLPQPMKLGLCTSQFSTGFNCFMPQ